MMSDEVLKLKDELDTVNSICRQQERQLAELKEASVNKDLYIEKVEETVRTQQATIKFLEGQVDAYQYCLNCRR